MGITGLLPQLKSVTENVNVSAYHSLTVGIDASCWLHRSVYGCATQLAMGQPTEAFVRFCENWLQMLLSNGVIPFFVFDGANLPAKQGTEASRKQSRDTAMEEGRAAYARGDLGAAHTAFTRAVDVTPTMAWQFIRVLRQRGIAYVVAPYEADAQLAYLCRQGIIQASKARLYAAAAAAAIWSALFFHVRTALLLDWGVAPAGHYHGGQRLAPLWRQALLVQNGQDGRRPGDPAPKLTRVRGAVVCALERRDVGVSGVGREAEKRSTVILAYAVDSISSSLSRALIPSV